MNSLPRSLAFDFDGILCNGLREYFQTAWRVYCQRWSISETLPPPGLAERFYQLRPVVEVGWEMPLIIRAVTQGFSDQDVLDQWPQIREQLVQEDQLDRQRMGQQVDGTRDQWIESDLDAWLGLHDFYPGVLRRLQDLQRDCIPFVIVTTKESRFVKQLLQRADIALEADQIFGKDCRRPKPETLKLLKQSLPQPMWFLEDRIEALRAVQAEPELQDVGLFLGDWGYNLERDRIEAENDPVLHRLSLTQFTQDFEQWLPC